MRTAIVRYNSGNVRSVKNAFDRLGVKTILTADPDLLRSADRVVFPGVGEASTAMQYLREHGLDKVIPDLKQPVLGICLGMQLLCQSSEENDTECLGLLPYKVRRFPEVELKVPHMGWNQIHDLNSRFFSGVAESDFMYFVHSYFVEICDETTARADHGVTFSAAISYRNFFAVQFHPEKSGPAGARILENFLKA
ncbi:MAG: imidazole glycerol phosphate synthase subunit HisH [Pyrinomonadaceae bacterium]